MFHFFIQSSLIFHLNLPFYLEFLTEVAGRVWRRCINLYILVSN